MSLFERRSDGKGNDPASVRFKLHDQFRKTFAAGTTLTMNTLWRASPIGIVANVIGGVCLTRREGEILVCAVNVGSAEVPKDPTQYLLFTKLGKEAMKLQSTIMASKFEKPPDDQYIGRDIRGASLLRLMQVSPLATRRATHEYSALLRSSTVIALPSIETLIHEDPSLNELIPPFPPDAQ